VIGSIFAFATIFVIRGFSGTDSITGAVAVKTQPVSMFLIGLFFLKERIKWADFIFSAIMLTSVIYVISKGTFQIGFVDASVIWLIIAPIMWNIGHSITKPLFNQKKISPTQLIFFRTGISLLILIIIYIFFGDLSQLSQFLSPPHLFFMFLMGLNYAFMHYFWYNTIKRIDLTIATSLIIPAPVITAIFAVFFLGENFYLYHLFGMIGTFIGIYGMLLVQKRKK
jgi:drug/metabolite transporter (DMT)-like permease